VNLAIAFVPAAAVGFLIHGWIKEYLFSPVTVAAALVVGGFGILAVERYRPKSTTESVDDVSNRSALGVGLAQILSLFPGVSRSGATIMGGMAIGLSRTAATEFSFFVAVPIMVAATGYELMSSRELLTPDLVPVLAVGFVTSFVSAAIVVKALLRFVSRHSFAPFAWYRIVFGGLLLVYYLGMSGA
jgi:undecaprenyl-diphosphatase